MSYPDPPEGKRIPKSAAKMVRLAKECEVSAVHLSTLQQTKSGIVDPVYGQAEIRLALTRVREAASAANEFLDGLEAPMSNPTPQKLQRVQIVKRDHPHFEEYGRFTGKIVTMRFGDGHQMAEVKLEHCRHGGDACFVSKGDVQLVAERD